MLKEAVLQVDTIAIFHTTFKHLPKEVSTGLSCNNVPLTNEGKENSLEGLPFFSFHFPFHTHSSLHSFLSVVGTLYFPSSFLLYSQLLSSRSQSFPQILPLTRSRVSSPFPLHSLEYFLSVPTTLPSLRLLHSFTSFLHSGLWKESNETHVLIPFHSLHHFSFLLPLLNTKNTHFLFSHTTLFFIRRRRTIFTTINTIIN